MIKGRPEPVDPALVWWEWAALFLIVLALLGVSAMAVYHLRNPKEIEVPCAYRREFVDWCVYRSHARSIQEIADCEKAGRLVTCP